MAKSRSPLVAHERPSDGRLSRRDGAAGPTKRASSRRQLRLPAATKDALRQHRTFQRAEQDLMGEQAGLGCWHSHELRHSAASLLEAAGVPLEEVADVLGHASTRVTSATYRRKTTSTVEAGARPMDEMFQSARHAWRKDQPHRAQRPPTDLRPAPEDGAAPDVAAGSPRLAPDGPVSGRGR